MILVIGACASGKRTYAKSLGYATSDMADAVLDNSPVIYNVQDLITRDCATLDTLEALDYDAIVEALSTKEVVICNEVGSGVVPAERNEREARELVGRMCLDLAARANRVVRLVCGIPQVLKG